MIQLPPGQRWRAHGRELWKEVGPGRLTEIVTVYATDADGHRWARIKTYRSAAAAQRAADRRNRSDGRLFTEYRVPWEVES